MQMAQVGADHLCTPVSRCATPCLRLQEEEDRIVSPLDTRHLSGETGEQEKVLLPGFPLGLFPVGSRPSNLISVPGGCRPGAGI